MVTAVKGYRCVFVMPVSVSIERMILLKTLGADIILRLQKNAWTAQ